MSDAARSEHLSIGEVLALVQQDFPDVTISKIRFLESQGLIAPERTGAGFRKFYDSDIERLRWILRQQGDHFLPLKVIKKMLEDGADPSGGIQTQPTLWSSSEDSDDVYESDGSTGRSAGGRSDPGEVSPDHAGGRGERYRSSTHPSVVSASGSRGTTAESTSVPSEGAARTRDTAEVVEARSDSSRGGSGSPRDAEKVSAATGSPSPNGGAESQAPAADSSTGASRGDSNRPAEPRSGRPGRDGNRSRSEQQQAGASKTQVGATQGSGGHRTLSTPADVVAALQEDPRPPARGRAAKPSGESSTAAVPGTGSTPESSNPAGVADDDSTQIRTPLTRAELSEVCGVPGELIDSLEQFGFISSTSLGGAHVYDEGALAITKIAARYTELGIEPRHLRMYKIAAEREAGMIEQLVVPLLKQRNPTARQNASERSRELAAMGAELHTMFLTHQLRRILGS